VNTSLLRIATGVGVALLLTWKYSSHQSIASQPPNVFRHSLVDAAAPAVRPNSAASSGDGERRLFPPRPSSTTDEGLRQLERDVSRAAQIANAAERENVLVAACLRWAEIDPADALRIARILGLDQVSNAVCEDIVQKWAVRDFSSAAVWANNEPPGEQRDHLMARLAYVRVQTQPALAAKFVVEQIPAGAIQTEAGISVLHQWALRDFDAAMAWANSFPGELQDRGREELAGIARFRLAHSDAR